jgi:hypothetical protein
VGNVKWPDYKGRLRSLGGGGFSVNRPRVRASVETA